MALQPRQQQASQVLITSDDFSPVVNIIAILFLILTGVAVSGRIFTKLATRLSLNLEDAAIISAFIFAAAQSAAMLVAANNGLGQRASIRDPSSQLVAEKAFYASNFLFITAIVLSKSSLIIFMRNLIPVRGARLFGLLVLIFLAAWWLAFVIASGLQCGASSPWASSKHGLCYSIPFWDTFDIISIVTDALLVVWPVLVVTKLKLSIGRKLFTIACFSSRLFALASMVVQLVLTQNMAHSKDITFDIWKTAVLIQLSQSLAVITACTPHLTTFFGSLVSGMLRVDDMRRQQGSNPNRQSYGVSASSRNSKRFSSIPGVSSQLSRNRSYPAPPQDTLAVPSVDGVNHADIHPNIIGMRTSVEISAEPREQSERVVSGPQGLPDNHKHPD